MAPSAMTDAHTPDAVAAAAVPAKAKSASDEGSEPADAGMLKPLAITAAYAVLRGAAFSAMGGGMLSSTQEALLFVGAYLLTLLGQQAYAGGAKKFAPLRPVPATGLLPVETEALLVKVNDKWYDLQKWKHVHPGGASILMHLHGTDVTDSFLSLHSEEAKARLGRMRPVPNSKLPADLAKPETVPPHMVAYREWMDELRADGKFDRTFYNEFTTGFPVFALTAAGLYLGHSWPVAATFLLALGQQQAGWFGHDNIHGRGKYCQFMGRLVGGWMGGMSRAWWSDKHNTHHVYTNCVDIDGDINNHPILFNYPPSKEHDQWNRVWQHVYAPLVYPLLYYSWRINSVKFCVAESRWAELFCELLPSYMLLSLVPLPVALASIWLGGLFVAFVVTLSHESEDLHFGAPEEFISAQFVGTRDIICPNWFMNWFFGGMQYQLEHHLFPTLPRVHYPWLQPKVEAYAKKYGLDFKASTLSDFMAIHYATLKRNALAPPKSL